MKNGRVALIGILLCLFVAVSGFSETTLKDLQKVMDDFSENMANSLPFNSTIGLNWSHAHIGQFLGVPPHFGVGVSLGLTTMDAGAFDNLLKQFGISSLPDFGGFPVPGYTVEGRIGGFVLPFDAGIKFGYMPLSLGDVKLDYLLVGGDIRYAVLKGNAILPTVSLGIGFNYMDGGLSKKIDEDRMFNFPYLSDTATLTVGAPDVGITWETKTLDFKAQVSKSLFIITPYLGLGASYGWSRAGYSIDSKITAKDSSDNPLALNDVRSAIKAFGIDNVDGAGFSSEKEISGLSFRTFGGLSFNLAFIKIDLTGMYNFSDGNYGVTLGTRFQL